MFIFFLIPSIIASDKADRIDEFMRLCHEYRIFDGSVLVAEAGTVLYKKAFGLANREWDVPNTLESKYVIGSISKQFAALLVLQLVEKNVLKLNGKISDYLPDFPKDKGDIVTIHQLLCHSSGIPNNQYFKNWYTELWQQEYTTQKLIELFYPLELEFTPGSRFSYSNTGYYILAAIIEKVTGKKYEKFLEEQIFEPLRMENSGVVDSYNILPNFTTGYMYWNFRFSKPPYSNPSSSKGAGSIYSTVEDMWKWESAFHEHKLISVKSQKKMFESHIQLRGSASYGYGVVIQEERIQGLDRSITSIEHSGNQPGYSCLFLRIPEETHSIIVLSNIDHIDLRLIKNGLLNILYGGETVVQKPISLVLSECSELSSIEKAIADYQNNNEKYSIRRDAVNGLGFRTEVFCPAPGQSV
jgi:CubicO group peptidase (beta-lactamase class C family)